jgi:hypothetical protein
MACRTGAREAVAGELARGNLFGLSSNAVFNYTAKTVTLTFAPGETTKTITIVVKGDSKREASEYFYLEPTLQARRTAGQFPRAGFSAKAR